MARPDSDVDVLVRFGRPISLLASVRLERLSAQSKETNADIPWRDIAVLLDEACQATPLLVQ